MNDQIAGSIAKLIPNHFGIWEVTKYKGSQGLTWDTTKY